MAELTVDMAYGGALYEAAKDIDKIQVILDEGQELLDIFSSEDDLGAFMRFPSIAVADKKQVIGSVFEGKICAELLNFLYILIDKRRFSHFEGIMKVYRRLVEQEEGCIYGKVYSVELLSAERLADVEKQTSELLQKKVKLENELDPKLMGGVRVFVEGKLIDASIKKKFDEMASQIMAN